MLVAAVALAAGIWVTQPATAGPNQLMDPSNGHARLSANGKLLPHPSGGSEVTYDDERAVGADTASSTDPPLSTGTALGCANRGSLTNPRVNQDCTARRQAEEKVLVNPTDPTNIIAGQNDSRIGFNKCGFDYSLDSGHTWGDGIPPFYQALSPLGHTYDAGSDPALAFDSTGRAWFSCVLFDVNSNASAIAVTPSTPGLKGSAYSNVAASGSPFIVAQDATGHHSFDKEFIAGGPSADSVFVTFTDFQSFDFCKKSFNKGGLCQSPIYISKWTGSGWTNPIQISGRSSLCTGGNTFNPQIPADACNFDQGSYPVVLPNGNVFVAFNNGNTPSSINQTLGVLVTVNNNTLTAGAPVRVGLDNESNVALCDFGRGPEQCVQSIFVRTNDFPAVAVDPTNANHLVADWTDSRSATSKGNDDVVVSESTDGGQTWTDGTGSGGGGTVLTTSTTYFEPAIAIAGDGHEAVTTYQASAATTDPAGTGTYGYGYLVNTGSGFGSYTDASDLQNYPSPQANPSQAGFLGDYSSAAGDPSSSKIYMVWADTRNASNGVPDEDVFMFSTTI
ncbi:MAG TPA: hypothetical protein VF137_07600 [Candidatus Dormibacteraeota bacterium]